MDNIFANFDASLVALALAVAMLAAWAADGGLDNDCENATANGQHPSSTTPAWPCLACCWHLRSQPRLASTINGG